MGVALMSCAASRTADQGEPVLLSRQECDRYGLTMAECKQIYQSGISISKVERLLGAGISMAEYFEQPWIRLDIPEKKWFKKRRAGLAPEDLELMYGPKDSDVPDSADEQHLNGQSEEPVE